MAHTQTAATPFAAPHQRPRLRAVARDEIAGLARVADFLPPGATLLPAPPHALPTLPGRPPMVGYLVLLPAEEHPPVPLPSPLAPPSAVPSPAAGPAAGPTTGPADGPVVAEGPVGIDGERRIATVDGRALDLTYLEFELLAHLVAHPHRVHTRDQLVQTVWGYGHVGDGRTVDVHVARLRRKLGAEHRHAIQTVRRVGYKYLP